MGTNQVKPVSPGGTIHDSLSGLASNGNVAKYTCSYTEVLAVALECSTLSAGEALGPDFCSSSCASKLLPFGRQCQNSMGAQLSAFGLESVVATMLNQCPTTPP